MHHAKFSRFHVDPMSAIHRSEFLDYFILNANGLHLLAKTATWNMRRLRKIHVAVMAGISTLGKRKVGKQTEGETTIGR